MFPLEIWVEIVAQSDGVQQALIISQISRQIQQVIVRYDQTLFRSKSPAGLFYPEASLSPGVKPVERLGEWFNEWYKQWLVSETCAATHSNRVVKSNAIQPHYSDTVPSWFDKIAVKIHSSIAEPQIIEPGKIDTTIELRTPNTGLPCNLGRIDMENSTVVWLYHRGRREKYFAAPRTRTSDGFDMASTVEYHGTTFRTTYRLYNFPDGRYVKTYLYNSGNSGYLAGLWVFSPDGRLLHHLDHTGQEFQHNGRYYATHCNKFVILSRFGVQWWQLGEGMEVQMNTALYNAQAVVGFDEYKHPSDYIACNSTHMFLFYGNLLITCAFNSLLDQADLHWRVLLMLEVETFWQRNKISWNLLFDSQITDRYLMLTGFYVDFWLASTSYLLMLDLWSGRVKVHCAADLGSHWMIDTHGNVVTMSRKCVKRLHDEYYQQLEIRPLPINLQTMKLYE